MTALALKLAVTAVLLALLLWRIDFAAMLVALGGLSAGRWLLNFLLLIVAYVVAAAKWHLLLPESRFATLLKLNFVGQYYGMLLPGQIAGEAVKAYRLGKGQQNAERVAASVVIDRITGFLGLLALAVSGVALSWSSARQTILVALLVAVVMLVALLFSFQLPWWDSAVRLLSRRGARAERVAGQLLRLIAAWRDYARAPLLLLVSVLLGAAFQLIAVWINFRIGQEVGLTVAFADWCWIFGIVSIVTALPFTVAGLGLREGSFVGALALLGVASEKAIAVSFVVFSLLLAGAAIGAVLEFSRARATTAATPAWNQ
jgi:uncharacterized protein (TIRG00374 family)